MIKEIEIKDVATFDSTGIYTLIPQHYYKLNFLST